MATPAAPFTRSPSLSYGRSTSRSFYGSPAPLAASLAAAESDHSSDSEPHAPAASPPPSPVPPRVERPLRALDAPIAARDARGKSLAYVSAMICGAACLAPWKAYLSAADYLKQNYDERAEFYVGLANMIPVVCGLLFMTAFGHRFSLTKRVYIALAGMCVCMTSPIAIDVAMKQFEWTKRTGLWLILGSLFLNACFSSVLQSSLYGLAAMLEPSFTGALQQGKGVVGVLIILIRMGTKALWPNDLRLGSFVFFGLAWFIVFIGFVFFALLMRAPYTTARLHARQEVKRTTAHDVGQREKGDFDASKPASSYASNSSVQSWIAEENVDAEAAPLLKPTSPIPVEDSRKRPSLAHLVRSKSKQARRDLRQRSKRVIVLDEPTAKTHSQIRHIVTRAWVPLLGVYLTFTVCIALFPGLSTALSSTRPAPDLLEWLPLLLILSFDFGDLLGKSLPAKLALLTTTKRLMPAILLHLIFVPLFILGVRPSVYPTVLDSQVFELAITLALGISSGYVGCSSAMLTPELVDRDAQERAGFVSTLCLVSGLFSGAVLAIPLANVVEK